MVDKDYLRNMQREMKVKQGGVQEEAGVRAPAEQHQGFVVRNEDQI